MKYLVLALMLPFIALGCKNSSSSKPDAAQEEKKKQQEQKPKENPFEQYRPGYQNLASTLKELREIDQDPLKEIEWHLNINALYYHLLKATKAEKAEIRAYIEEYKKNPVAYSAYPESFEVTLPPNASLRVPMHSFCMNRELGSPRERERFKLEPLSNESALRRLALYHFAISKETDFDRGDIQSLVWDIENLGTKTPSGKVEALLGHFDISVPEDATLQSLEASDAVQAKIKELSLDVAPDLKGLSVNLISYGYSTANMIFHNTTEQPITLTSTSLLWRMVPTYKLDASYFSLQTSQNIGTSRVDWYRWRDDRDDRSSGIWDWLTSDEEIETNDKLTDRQKAAAHAANRMSAQLRSRGEYEEAERYEKELEKMLKDTYDWANDTVRDHPIAGAIVRLEEIFSGKGFFTNEALSMQERADLAAELISSNINLKDKLLECMIDDMGLQGTISAEDVNLFQELVEKSLELKEQNEESQK